jgi:cytochrome c2
MTSLLWQRAATLGLCATMVCASLSACATSSAAAIHTPTTVAITSTAQSAQGQAIFGGQVQIAGFIACQTCHPINPRSPNGAGPNLAGVALRAGTRVPGLDAHNYLRRSIRVHDEYVVPGFAPGIARAVVGRDFGAILSDDQVEQLVSYLLTLDQPPVALGRGPEAGRATPLSGPSPKPSASPSPKPSASPTALASPEPSPRPSETVAPSITPAPRTPTSPPAAAPTPTAPPPVTATQTPVPPVEELPGAPNDPELARYAPCVACHNQHPRQVQMPHPLNPTCNTCHRGAPNQIGCPSCHSMHTIDNKHEAAPDLACATCHT